MEGKKYKLTPKKIKELTQELEHLRVDERKRIADLLDTLRDETLDEMDTSIIDILDEKDSVERRIIELKDILSNHEVLEHVITDKAILGSIVLLESDGKEFEYELVSSVEADPLESKISEESPLGIVLMGKKKGDKAAVENGDVKKSYKILSIK